MTPREVALYVGCDESHVRRMIRGGRLAATAYQLPNGSYCYSVSKQAAEAYRKRYATERRGRPRKDQAWALTSTKYATYNRTT